jgi:hypothetical protein
MLGVFADRKMHSDSINNQPDVRRTDSMSEGTRSMLCMYVTVLGEMLDESIVGKLARLGKTVHAFVAFDDNMSVVDEGLELVLLHDAGRNDFDGIQHGPRGCSGRSLRCRLSCILHWEWTGILHWEWTGHC